MELNSNGIQLPSQIHEFHELKSATNLTNFTKKISDPSTRRLYEGCVGGFDREARQNELITR